MAKILNEHEKQTRIRYCWVKKANLVGVALERVVAAVGVLDFEDQRMVLRAACDALGVSVKNLPLIGEGRER